MYIRDETRHETAAYIIQNYLCTTRACGENLTVDIRIFAFDNEKQRDSFVIDDITDDRR